MVVEYVVPDNPKDRLALNENRKANRVPVYEDNLPLVYETMKKVLLSEGGSDAEIEEFDSIAVILEKDTYFDLKRRAPCAASPEGQSVWE